MNSVELINFINNVKFNKSKNIPGYPGSYAINISGIVGVAVEVNSDFTIRENFNKVQIADAVLTINDTPRRVITLFTKENTISLHYGFLCLDFIDSENRTVITTNPFEWYNRWKELLGNSSTSKKIYDIVAEMKTLLILKQKGLNPKWESVDWGTYDISTIDELYEVKSTTSKTVEIIEINNQYQLNPTYIDKPLNIAFCKVEKSSYGDSIDSLYNELINYGFSEDDLDDYLNERNLGKGKTERYITFIINEIRVYSVDDDFPKISKDSFVNSVIPKGVVKYSYAISLDGLKYKNLL